MFATICLGVLIALFAVFIWRRKEKFKHFKRLGIPGPEPNFFLGNLFEYQKLMPEKFLTSNTKKYGKVWGYFQGSLPRLVISDLDMLKEIFIKQFHNFYARQIFKPVLSDDRKEDKKKMHLFTSHGEQWKQQRVTLNPAFSAAKLKMMTSIFRKWVDEFMNKMTDKQNNEINIHENFQELTLLTISEIGFGLEVEKESAHENPFLVRLRKVFTNSNVPKIMALYFIFPEFENFWSLLDTVKNKLFENPFIWFQDQLGVFIEHRKESGVKRTDLLQLLLDAEVQDTDSNLRNLQNLEVTSMEDDQNLTEYKSKGAKKLSIEEIKANCMLFMLAGYETTSTTLAYAAYRLATTSRVQEKLQKEIDENIPSETSEVTYDTLKNMKYLDMVLSETLRLHPLAAHAVFRRCMASTADVCGFTFKKNDTITPDIFSIHHDPELWGPEDPDNFYPERFGPEFERPSIAYLPFGTGPRNCIGMRFAQVEFKLALALLLKKFTLKIGKDYKLEYHLGPTLIPKNGVTVTLESRM